MSVPASVFIRSATADDVPRLVALLDSGSLEAGKEDPGDLRPYHDALGEIMADHANDILVAETGGQVVGVCQLVTFRHLQSRGGRCAELESLHVDSEFRSRGVGGALVEAAAERARNRGCYRLQLSSNKRRADAHRFYARHGFAATHEGMKRRLMD